MRFAFTELQEEFQREVRNVLSKACTPATIRMAWGEAGATEPDRSAWNALAEMGVLDVMVPEADGGLGMDEVTLVLILQEAGYAGLPDPLVETAAVAMPLAASSLTERPVTVTTNIGGPIVPWAADADHVLVRDDNGGVRLVGQSDVTVEPVETVDVSRRAGLVSVNVGASTVVTETAATIDLAFDRGALGTAAVLIGLGQRMLDLTVGYVSERKQFGVPIGSFQAVKHHLANAAKDLAFARPAVYRAALSLATGDPARVRDVSMAKAMASDAAERAGRAALQCHGAIGYTMEYDLHLYLKRAWALERSWGDSAFHRNRVAAAIGV
jgi:alkylation response protein AidB-like acyl-CoA dehydrogenase